MRKVLIAIYGHEPAGWAEEVVQALSPTDTSLVRVLVVLDVPSPRFTSLLPVARRYYGAALTTWRRLVEEQTRRSIEALSTTLGRVPDVVQVLASDADAAWPIVEHAVTWDANVIIVGRDTAGGVSRTLFAPTHMRVVNSAPCAVLVTSAERDVRPRPVEMKQPDTGRRSPAAVPGGA
jgi:nucleotide-binding universal stress UspA family protein